MDKIAGVYVIECPKGVYVGQAADCFKRNEYVDKLGLEWGIVREMVGSTKRERLHVERAVADQWAERGLRGARDSFSSLCALRTKQKGRVVKWR